ncbi:MAG TPA: MFS transporter [Actinomycetota bacterium]|nr:MFS transporter [Actinomycetota bacterium]
MIRDLGLRGGGGGRSGTAARTRAEPTLLTPVFVRVAIAELAYFTADGVLVPVLPRYVTGQLGAGNVAVGVVIGAFSLSAFFLRPWAGRAADRRGRRALMVAGASLFAISVLGYLVSTSVSVLAALRLLTGAGEALFFVGAVSANMDLAPPERRGEAMSFASLSLYVGLGAGPLIGEAVVASGGFAAAWLVSIALGLVAVGLSLRLPPMRPLPSEGATAPHRLVHPAGLLPGVVLFAAIWGMGGFLAFVPLYVADVGMSGAGAVLGLFAGTVVAIRSLGARIPDRFGAAATTRVSLALVTAGLAVIGLWRTPGGLLAGTVVLGVGVALFTPAVFALAVEGVAADERGSVMGTTSAFLDLAFGLGPASLGFVAAGVGRGGTFLVGAAVAAAGFALVLVTRLGGRSERTPPGVGAR